MTTKDQIQLKGIDLAQVDPLKVLQLIKVGIQFPADPLAQATQFLLKIEIHKKDLLVKKLVRMFLRVITLAYRATKTDQLTKRN